jgi:diguanylate cyclase (GGDEF)-like protein
VNPHPPPGVPSLLSRLRWLGLGALVPLLLLNGALLWPGVVDEGLRLGLRALVVALELALGVLLWITWRQLRQAQAQSERALARQQALIESLPHGIVLWNPDGTLQQCNAHFRALYEPLLGPLAPGLRFEDLLHRLVAAGGLPEGGSADWIAQRLAAHRAGGTPPVLRQMPDGSWRQIEEHRLPDGTLLGHSLDVTALVQRERALQAAQREAEVARQRLLDAIEALPAGFELYDAEDRLVLTNRMAREMYPLVADLAEARPTFDEVVRTHQARGGLPMDAGTLEQWLARRHAERRQPGAPHVMRQADGRVVRVYERRTREGGVVGVRIDVTALEDARAAAEQARQRLEDALDALPDGFVMYDAEDRLVLCNRRYREMYAETADLIVPGVRFEDLLRAGLARGQYPQAVGREEAWVAERLAAHRAPSGPVLQELPGDRWLRIDERRTRDGGIAGVRADVTELVRRGHALQTLNEQLDALNLELRTQSQTDPLTGLANRRLFEQRLAEEVLRAQRHGLPVSLLALDVDHFKRFNDRYGHPAGDAALVQVARALQSLARRPADLAARTGGEEFALLLPHTAAAEAQALAEQLLTAVDSLLIPHADSSTARSLTLSIGVATLAPGMDMRTLVRAADEALYRAKAEGRHRVAVSAFGDIAPQ